MRNYARFTTGIYRDGDFRALTVAQQGIYFLLSLQPEMTAAGTLSLTLRRWAGMADDMTAERLRDELKVIEERGHIVVDEDTEELLIVKFVKFDGGIGNEKRRPVIEEAASAIGSIAIRHRLAHEIGNLGYGDMASKLRPDRASPPLEYGLSDSQSGFDRSVVKQGDQIPHSALHTPQGGAEAAYPIPPDDSVATAPPSMYCSKHPEGTEQPCGPCADARKRYAAHAQVQLEAEVEAKRARTAAIAGCELCDEHGKRLDPHSRLPVGACDHVPVDNPEASS